MWCVCWCYKLLYTVDEGNSCHCDELSLCLGFINAVESIDWAGTDIVTVLECICDPSPVFKSMTGWDIFSNCTFRLFWSWHGFVWHL